MADTRRTLAALQALLADNTSGDISANDARDVLVSDHPTNVNQTGTVAAIPSSGQLIGDRYLSTDGQTEYRWNGSLWVPWGPIYPFTPPVDGDFAWVNQGTASVVTTTGGITLVVPNAAATDINMISRVKSAPATPYTVTAYWSASRYTNNYHMAGLIFREAGTGELVFFGSEFNAGLAGVPLMTVMYCANNTTITTRYVSETGAFWGGNILQGWWRLADNGTNRIFSVSHDKQNWLDVLTQTRTTDTTPDQIGFGMSSRNQSGTARTRYLDLLSWEQA